MRRCAGILAALVAGFAFQAQARPASSAMTCAAARALVMSQGAAVLDTSATTFERIVSDGSSCRGATLAPAIVHTRDQQACFIGYTCEPRLSTVGGT